MSGPKVVRIVTREELVAICEGLIAVLETAVVQWQRFGERNDVIDEGDIAMARERVVAMRSLLSAGRFADLQKQLPGEISFLKSDIDRRVQKAAETAARARKHGRQLAASARTLALALQEKGLPVPDVLNSPEGRSKEVLEHAVSAAFSSLSPPRLDGEVSARQRDIAEQLGLGEERLSLATWLESNEGVAADDPLLLSLERKLDELRALDREAGRVFEGRVAAIDAEDAPLRRGLLADSLTIELAEAKRKAVVKFELVFELEGLQAQLRAFQAESAAEEIRSIEVALSGSGDAATLRAAAQQAEDVLKHLQSQKAEIHRRSALLQGLAKLGYEVKQGMETAWVNDGRIVLRNASSPDYGVELGGDPDKLVQVRTVALGDSAIARNQVKDVEAETKFCGEFATLCEDIAANGGSISVVKALGVGTTAMKTVAVGASNAEFNSVEGNLDTSRKL